MSPTLIAQADWPARGRSGPPRSRRALGKCPTTRATYSTDGKKQGETWIRYRAPGAVGQSDADRTRPDRARAVEPRPQLITDFYAYNTRRSLRQDSGSRSEQCWGLHWVGDLSRSARWTWRATEARSWLDLRQRRAALPLPLRRGHRQGDALDRRPAGHGIAHGRDRRSRRRPAPVRFANVDHQLRSLGRRQRWSSSTRRPPTTTWTTIDRRPTKSGDLAPWASARGERRSRSATCGSSATSTTLPTAAWAADHGLRDPSSTVPLIGRRAGRVSVQPSEWNDAGRQRVRQRQVVTFELDPDQFFVLGDNSPAEQGRPAVAGSALLWIPASLLIGKALFIYWPHSWDNAGHRCRRSRSSRTFADMGFDNVRLVARAYVAVASPVKEDLQHGRCSKSKDW